MKRNSLIVLIGSFLFILFFSVGYVYLLKTYPPEIPETVSEPQTDETIVKESEEEYTMIKIFFPANNKLIMEQREIKRVFSQKKILKLALTELLKGPEEMAINIIPDKSLLLGVYIGNDGIAYVNFSEEFRRNFRGDIIDEYLLLKSIYETVITNIRIDDVRILIENKEVDTLAGHFLGNRPLKQIVTQELKFE